MVINVKSEVSTKAVRDNKSHIPKYGVCAKFQVSIFGKTNTIM